MGEANSSDCLESLAIVIIFIGEQFEEAQSPVIIVLRVDLWDLFTVEAVGENSGWDFVGDRIKELDGDTVGS